MIGTRIWLPAVLLLATAGCDDSSQGKGEKPAVTVAPTSSALAPVKAPTSDAKKLTVDKDSSKVDFLMEAPEEHIHGKVWGATTGDLNVDFMDVTKSTGLITVDISGMEVFQTKAKGGKFDAKEDKVEAQNKHARTWLEISDDAPEDVRKKNSLVQFSIKSLSTTGEKNLTKLTGAERKVMLTAVGDFLLHGHKAEKTAELEATFKFDGDKPVSVSVKTVKPFAIGLAEHDVKPRDAFGKFAAKTLDVLAPKVNKEAFVSLDYTAKVAP